MFSLDVLMQSICKRKGIVKVPALVEKRFTEVRVKSIQIWKV